MQEDCRPSWWQDCSVRMFLASWLALPIASVRKRLESPALEQVNFRLQRRRVRWQLRRSGWRRTAAPSRDTRLDVKLVFLAGGLAPVAVMAGEVRVSL